MKKKPIHANVNSATVYTVNPPVPFAQGAPSLGSQPSSRKESAQTAK